jgi:enterochelin esterase-like enzyme
MCSVNVAGAPDGVKGHSAAVIGPRLPPARRLGGASVRVWSSTRTRRPVPLLVVHDGREYARRADLLGLLAHADLPPLRVALLDSPDCDEHYSASGDYARSLAREILPALPAATCRIGVGASLGALALLHAHVAGRAPFDGLFLQSGSYFRRATDPQERRFPRFARITRFVERVERAHAAPIPVTMTCGTKEENLGNNRIMRSTLSSRGYDVRLHVRRGGHDWDAWRSVLDPHLLRLIRRLAR